jgi:SAM-dependent methyltransferase
MILFFTELRPIPGRSVRRQHGKSLPGAIHLGDFSDEVNVLRIRHDAVSGNRKGGADGGVPPSPGSLDGLRLLDIGCGEGGWIRRFIHWGARPELIFGIDAIEERIAEARHLTPAGVTLICGNAADLQFADESFDLVMLFECLCIITDSATRVRMASEAPRLARRCGL